jgi:hypothetical protein
MLFKASAGHLSDFRPLKLRDCGRIVAHPVGFPCAEWTVEEVNWQGLCSLFYSLIALNRSPAVQQTDTDPALFEMYTCLLSFRTRIFQFVFTRCGYVLNLCVIRFWILVNNMSLSRSLHLFGFRMFYYN